VNCEKINEHGKRAASIIQNMLIHARTSKVDKSDIDINSLLEEYLNLAYHGMRAQNSAFNAKFEKNLDKNLGKINANQQSLGRVFLNIINNGLYAANEKAQKINKDFIAMITITTSQSDKEVLIKIKDNGNGMPLEVQKKIFEPFFTTKPVGQGTGLGLPICYDIVVNELQGKLDVVSKEGEYTEFTITIPKESNS
jgi:signal transduction histidine kinase